MSRGHDARRKAKRRQARASVEPECRGSRSWQRRSLALVPTLLIAAILTAVGIAGFGERDGISKEQVRHEVADLLDGVPQRRTTLGSPTAPITVRLYADLECPTVKLFAENYLPSIVDTWVRTGIVKLDYRSLETDTVDEEEFFDQETAALAAGRQDRMWNFLLTFVRQQGEVRTGYATDEFLTGIGSQTPGLQLARWRRDRDDARLSKQVALGVYSGHNHGLDSTPSLLVGFTAGAVHSGKEPGSTKREIETSLRSQLASLNEEALEDFPTLRAVGPNVLGG